MVQVKLWNPTRRHTPAHIVEIGTHRFYFSYNTCIAYHGPNGCARIENHWGPTTGRHFNEMEIKYFPIVSDEEFEKIITLEG